MTNPLIRVASVNAWDRLAIIALGFAGCALSYDALQQMAVAIHVRGFLTYLFPLVVDGFIAYGVRALLVLATAPLRARLYVWTLFGTATAASIWANALHAVRLNQQTASSGGLRLGDTVVAVLSTLAPLALAGAVHLYILITRHHPGGTPRTTGEIRRTSALPDQTSARLSRDELNHRSDPDPDHRRTPDQPPGKPLAAPGAGTSGPDQTAGRKTSGPKPPGPTSDRTTGPKPPTPTPDQTTGPKPPTPTPDQTTGSSVDPVPLEDLIPIAREAALAGGRMTRRVIGPYLRQKNMPIGNERFSELQEALYRDPALAHLPRPRKTVAVSGHKPDHR